MARHRNVDPKHIGGDLFDLKQELMEDPGFRLGWKLFDMAAEIGRLASEMRKKAGFTQLQLASRLDVDQSLIARLESENPRRMPTFATVARIAGACGYDMEVVFRRGQQTAKERPLVLSTRDLSLVEPGAANG